MARPRLSGGESQRIVDLIFPVKRRLTKWIFGRGAATLLFSSIFEWRQRPTRHTAASVKASARLVLVQWIHLMEALEHTFRSTFSKGKRGYRRGFMSLAQCATMRTHVRHKELINANALHERKNGITALTVFPSAYSRFEIVFLFSLWRGLDVGWIVTLKRNKIVDWKFICETRTFSFATSAVSLK